MGKKSRAKRAVAPIERHPGDNSGLAGIIGELITNRQYAEAFRAASVLVEQDPLDANAHAVMALLLARTDRYLEALGHYELAIRLGRGGDATLYAGLASCALAGQLLFHAVMAARQGVVLAPSPENQQIFRAIIDAGQQQISQLIGARSVPVDVAEQAMLLVERSGRARLESDFERARGLAIEATEAAPQLPATWYNLALLQWTVEDVPAAIAACEQGIETLQEENHELLAAEVRAQAFSGQDEAARATLQRLVAVAAGSTAQKTEVAKGYAALDEDQSVYDTLSGVPAGEELPMQLLMLGVSAANLGKREDARAAWRGLVRDQNPQARAFSEIMARNEKPPTPGARYPYFMSIDLVPGLALDRLLAAARTAVVPSGVADAAALYPKLAAGLCEAFIMQTVDPRFLVQLLLQIPDEASVAAIGVYAAGRLPSDHDRLFAHIALRGASLVDAAEPASIWLAGKRLNIVVPAISLTMPRPSMRSSEVDSLLRDASAAQRENALNRAIDLYRRVLEIEPATTEAEHNLGTALMLSGRVDEGVEHVKRSLELDDTYAVARCNLASLELSRGRQDEAIEYMAPLDSRSQMTLEEIVAYLRTKADIARAQGDAQRSQELLHCLLAFDRNNTLATELLSGHAGAGQSAG